MASFINKFESRKQEWETPQLLFERLDQEFNFTFDLAADATNTKCQAYYDIENNALEHEWVGVIGWLNPPYGSRLYKLSNWIKKAYQETQKYSSTTVVMLIPARTNTSWWAKYCMKAKELWFIEGRPKFGNAKYGLPQPLVIVVFQQHTGDTKLYSFKVK